MILSLIVLSIHKLFFDDIAYYFNLQIFLLSL